jgi:hypothetical protein
MAQQAGDEPDEEARRVLLEDAAEAARDWCCPRVCGAKSELDEEHKDALRAIRRLTGHEFKPRCPLSGAWAPWVHRAVEAEEFGLVEYRAAYGAPPRTLVEAVSVIRRAKRARDAEEARVRREERDR